VSTDRPDDRPTRARGLVTPAERARVAELHGKGWTRAAIARQLGRSPDTIGRIGADLGLTWDGSKTAAATARKVIDNRARRAELIRRAYEEAGEAVDGMRLGDDGLYLAVGTAANGATVVTPVPVVPPLERKALASSFGVLTNSAARLEALDSGDDTTAAKSMLGQIAKELGIAADAIREAEGR
jgi:Helix-turn-helix domain